MSRFDLRMEPQQVNQFRGTGAQNAGQRHAVYIAAGAALGRIHVGVRIQPDHADSFVARAKVAGNTAHRAYRHGMVAAEHQWQESAGKGFVHTGGESFAGGGDQPKVLGARVAFRPGFFLFDVDVTPVLYLVPERSRPRMQVGDANGGWARIDATAALPQSERRADN